MRSVFEHRRGGGEASKGSMGVMVRALVMVLGVRVLLVSGVRVWGEPARN